MRTSAPFPNFLVIAVMASIHYSRSRGLSALRLKLSFGPMILNFVLLSDAMRSWITARSTKEDSGFPFLPYFRY